MNRPEVESLESRDMLAAFAALPHFAAAAHAGWQCVRRRRVLLPFRWRLRSGSPLPRGGARAAGRFGA